MVKFEHYANCAAIYFFFYFVFLCSLKNISFRPSYLKATIYILTLEIVFLFSVLLFLVQFINLLKCGQQLGREQKKKKKRSQKTAELCLCMVSIQQEVIRNSKDNNFERNYWSIQWQCDIIFLFNGYVFHSLLFYFGCIPCTFSSVHLFLLDFLISINCTSTVQTLGIIS